jgi:L-Ala-D/L-Glu epimerase
MTYPADALTVSTIRCFPIRFDFRMGVTHGLASRSYTENIYVQIESVNGHIGFGEGVPRSYVTGETTDSVIKALGIMITSIEGKTFSSPDELYTVLRNLGMSEHGYKNPAALCALELALLDLAGKQWCVPVTQLLRIGMCHEILTYSLIVPLLPLAVLPKFLKPAREFRFKHVKVKVDAADPVTRVAIVKDALGDGAEVRVDVNCSWTRDAAKTFCDGLASLGVASVEQPLAANDLEGTACLRRDTSIPITLDESVKTPSDIERAVKFGACDIINVRVSKCGGLLGAIRVIESAQHHNLGVQLGAQVGESCILSAAGAHLACGTPSFRWLEGFFGTHLLQEDLCTKDIRFGHGGLLVPPRGPGLGVTIENERVLRAQTLYSRGNSTN